MKKRKWAVLLLIPVLLAMGIYRAFFDMNALPQGELLASYPSPLGNYRIDLFLCNSGATTDYAVRGAVVDTRTGRSRNIYWQYHQSDAAVDWINGENVLISGTVLGEAQDIVLNITKNRYDYRNVRK